MAYIGRPASTTVAAIAATDTFTGNGATQFQLSRAVADGNASAVEVFVSNVQQQPTVTYTVSGNVITFTEAPGSGEPIYVIFRDYPTAPVFTIPDNSVTGAKLVTDAVAETNIQNNAVTTNKIADSAITTAKIEANAITSLQVAANAITSLQVAANAITSAKIEANAITSEKIAPSITLANVTITGGNVSANTIVTGTLPGARLPAGSVLQVVSTTKTDTFTTTSTSFTTITGLTASITPSSATSKIMIFVSVNGSQQVGVNDAFIGIFRDSTQIALGDSVGSRVRHSFLLNSSDAGWSEVGGMNFLDSPATTSAISYSVRARVPTTGTLFINRSKDDSDSVPGAGRTISTITVMEIAA